MDSARSRRLRSARTASRLRLSDDVAERRCRANLSEGHACHPDDGEERDLWMRAP
jgi:hypothetical protein